MSRIGASGLRRSRDARVLAGVCGGIAESLGMRPWSVRVLFAFMSLVTGVLPGVLAYAVLWRLMPERRTNPDAEALGLFVDPEDPTAGWDLDEMRP